MLVKEIVYMVLDLAKAATSDDSYFNEDHVIFLLKKYRSFLIKKEQEKQKATTDIASEFEYQQICLDLEKVPAIDGEPCTGGYYLRTTKKIPKILEDNQPRVYPVDFYQGINISYIPRDRMRYVGTNKFLQNIIYVSLGPDLHLYLNSSNPQFLYLKKLRMSAVFEDFDDISCYLCDDDGNSKACDVLDEVFPIREYLVPTLMELVVKELTTAKYQPVDEHNNASDDMSKVSTKQS
nr:MAG TPA: Structural protein [Crassvirales sp.]DAU82407.1 MAG TPA: Structural protein [Crassvirales sp.]